VSLGVADRQGRLLDDMERFCGKTLAESSIYALLHRERDRLFPDEMFADLFSDRGRRSVPPSVVATVMVLQRLEGLSDREATERYAFDARWRYAAGVGSYDCGGWGSFAHTVLVDMRARLAASGDPRRIFEVTVEAAAKAGMLGAKRVLDSTPLYDAVATMDTITLLRSAVKGLLRAADDVVEAELRAVLSSGDDYASSAKPQIDWDDPEAKEALIDSRARDAIALILALQGRQLSSEVTEAAALLAAVIGQDLEVAADGSFAIARRVAKDRIISTVDPEARHGHKTSAHGFDGYKGHLGIDPDSEIITDTAVSAGNVGDAAVAATLINDLIDSEDPAEPAEPEALAAGDDSSDGSGEGGVSARRGGGGGGGVRRAAKPRKNGAAIARTRRAEARKARRRARADRRRAAGARRAAGEIPTVYGDAAYGSGEFLDHLARAGIEARCKTQPPVNTGGRFAKDRFVIDLDAETVTCPAAGVAPIRRDRQGDGIARFGSACAACPLRADCTTAADGRSIVVGRHEARLADARAQAADPEWVDDYRSTRPKVERKIGHLMRRRHGGRRARVRSKTKVDADFNLLAAAVNLGRLAVLQLRSTSAGWTAAMP
jgi:hypothetical protein